MRPPVIGYNDIEQAVEVVRSKGKSVNPYQIRKILGKGSEAKIAYYLKAMGHDIEYQDDDPLATKLSRLIRPAVLELNEDSARIIQERTSKLTEELKTEISKSKALEEETKKCETRIRELESSLGDSLGTQNQLSGDLSSLEQQHREVKENNRSLTTEVSHLKGNIKDLKSGQDTMQRQHDKVIFLLRQEHADNLASQREATEQAKQVITTLKADLQRERYINSGLTDKIIELEVTIEELKTKMTSIEENNRKLVMIKNDNERSIVQKDSEIKDQKTKSEKSTNEIEEHRAKLGEADEESKNLKKENEKLTAEVSLLKSLLHEFKNID